MIILLFIAFKIASNYYHKELQKRIDEFVIVGENGQLVELDYQFSVHMNKETVLINVSFIHEIVENSIDFQQAVQDTFELYQQSSLFELLKDAQVHIILFNPVSITCDEDRCNGTCMEIYEEWFPDY